MATVTNPILLDSTGQQIVTKLESLKNVLAKTGTLNITANGTYDVTEKGTAVVSINPEGKIIVTAETGSTVTCAKDSVTLTATEESGTWTFYPTSTGTWTITATKGSNTKSAEVTVTDIAIRKTIAYTSLAGDMELGDFVTIKETVDGTTTNQKYYKIGEDTNYSYFWRKDVVINSVSLGLNANDCSSIMSGRVSATAQSNITDWKMYCDYTADWNAGTTLAGHPTNDVSLYLYYSGYYNYTCKSYYALKSNDTWSTGSSSNTTWNSNIRPVIKTANTTLIANLEA